MLLPILNLVFAFIGGYYLHWGGGVPDWVRWVCIVLGSIYITSRMVAWFAGVAAQAYVVAASHEDKAFGRAWRNRMVATEVLMFWVAGTNVSYFFR